MSPFRRFSRRFWPLHAYLMISMILWPVPSARSYWTDSNQDGVKEWVENPADPQDSWWDDDNDSDGLTNAQEALFGSDPYAMDSDRDGLSDLVERDYTPPSAPFDPWSWDTDGDGYSDHDEYYFMIQGSPLVVHYPSLSGPFYDYRDADGDGLLNYEDSDPTGMDRDGDGLLNWQDMYMDDPNDGYVPPAYVDYGVYIGGTWYPSGTLDSDGDNTPDHLDPFPWGSYWYNGIEYGGSWADRDWDGIPDAADAYPDGSYWYNGVEYPGLWSDMDGDGIPDPADPTPVYVESYWYDGTEYLGTWQDTDGDTIPDPADGWPNDRWNGQPYFTYNGSEYPGAWEDRDGDTVPDAADSWPDDPENGADDDNDGLSNYDERTQHFTDPAKVDTDHDWLTDYEELYVFHTNPKAPRSGLASGQTLLDGQLHLGADTDGDDLPDVLEDYYASLGYGLDKNDPADGAGDLDSDGYTNAQAFTFGWSLIANRGTYDQDGDGIDDAVEDFWAALYPGSMDKTVFEDAVADHDQDGLMNYEEVVRHNINSWLLPADPGDPWSLMRTLGYEVVLGTTPNDGQLMRWWWDVSRADYGGVDNGNPVPADATLLDVNDVDPAPNGLPDGYERWLAVLGPETNTARAILADEDGDGMPNVWEHRHEFDPRDGTDAGPATGPLPQAPVAPVAPVAPDPQVVGYVRDSNGVLVWNQDAYDAAESLYQDALAAYPDLLAAYDEQMASLQAYLESVDPDEDGLSNLREHLEGTHPRLADTDGDGYSDGAEVEAGSQPLVVTSMPSIQLQILSGANQQIYSGSASAPVVLRVVHAGQPVPGKQVRLESLSPGITVAATSGGTAATSLVLAADAAGKVEVCIHVPASQAAGTVQLQASLEDHLQAPVPFAVVIAEPGIAQLRPDLWAGLSGGGGADAVAFTPGVSAVLLKRSSGVFGGGYSAGTPGTTEPTWVPDGPPVDRENQTSREEYDNTPGDTVFFLEHDDPQLGTLYTWRKQKMKPGDPIIINGTPASASAYMAANDKYQGGTQVIETAAQVEAKGENGRYAGNIEGFLTFAPMSDADRAAKGIAAENTQARAGKSRYPDAGWSQLWLTTVVPATQDVTRSYLVKRENADGTQTIGSFSLTVKRGDKVSTVSEQTQAVDGLKVSGGIATLKPSVPSTDGEHVTLSLLPMELVPEKVTSNGDFDEGDTGGTAAQETGAIADNRNHTLIAERNSVDGRVSAGDVVTDDLHQGWFGLRPGVMPDDFFNGATVTITKKTKTDPDTGKREPGQVRFFATWGTNQELMIQPDDPFIDDLLANNPAPRNLVGKVYGTSKTVPSGATFWIEGVAPGKITLEYRIQKGSTDIKHEQTFEVRTEWAKAQWLAVVRDEIYLDSFTSSSGAGKNGFNNTGIDMNQYVVANDFLPNRPYIYSVYEYYAKLHDKERDKFLWAGLAKLAGGPVYAGMSDAQYGKEGAAIPRGAGIIVSTALQNIQDLLIDANINIYNDLAYQFVAFRTGGIKSMKYLKDQGNIDGPVYDAWKQLDEDGDVSSANQTLLQREQRDILRITYLNLDAMLDGWVSWMFSILTNNPIPGGPSFQTVIPNGNIAIYNDRWAWITDAQQGMWPLWMSKPNTQRQSLANQNLKSNAAGFSLFLNLLPLR